jgi:hypothetical protein
MEISHSACVRLGLDCQSSFEKNLRNISVDSVSEAVKKRAKTRDNYIIDNSTDGTLLSGQGPVAVYPTIGNDLENGDLPGPSSSSSSKAVVTTGRSIMGTDNSALTMTFDRNSAAFESIKAIDNLPSHSNEINPLVVTSTHRELWPRTTNIPMVPTTSGPHFEHSLITHYERNMQYSFSLRDSGLNYCSLLIPIVKEGDGALPLRSSLLAWSAFNLEQGSAIGLQHYHWASGVMDSATKGFSSVTSTPIKVGNYNINNLEVIILTTLFLFRSAERLKDYKSLEFRANQFCVWIFPLLGSLPSSLSPFGCRTLLWILYTCMRTFFLSPSVSRDLLAVFNQRQILSQLCAKGKMYLAGCFGRDYPTPEWIDDMEQDLVKHGQKLLRVMFIFTDIMALRENNHQLTSRDISGIEEQINSLQSEFDAEALRKVSIDRIDFHWLTDQLMLDSAVILLRRIANPTIIPDNTALTRANHILQLVLLFKRANHDRTSYYYMWPISLVFAALELEDEIKLDWLESFLLDTISRYTQYSDGIFVFLKEVRARQHSSPTRKVDIFAVIRELQLEVFA